MEQPKLLRLNLQHFADPTDPPTDPIDPPANPEPTNPTGGDPATNPEAKFTQADIDRIVKERLEREKRKREEALDAERKEAERKRLEEEQKYKELYEAQLKEIEAQKATALQTKKEALLVKAGYSDEQAKTLIKLVEGDDDEALSASIENVKTLFPPTKEKPYGDPNPGNGGHQKPKPKDLEDKGKSAYQRLKALGKIKGRKS